MGRLRPQQEQPIGPQPGARLLPVREPAGTAGRQAAHGVDQVPLEVRAELRHAVAIGVGLQVPVDHQRKRTTHQSVEDVVVTVDRLPADAGKEVRDDDAVVLRQVLERGSRHDQGQCEHAQAARLGGVRPPANEVASGTARCQPVAQGDEELRPLATRLVGHDQVAEHPVQFAAQATDEGGQAPARFKLAAHRDRRPSGEDVRVGALQAVERDLQPEVQQAGR